MYRTRFYSRLICGFLPLTLALTTACAGNPQQKLATQGELDSPANTAPEPSRESEIMYRLMVGELAGHVGKVGEAVANYMEAARLSTDPEVAERATRIALFAGRQESALEAAERWRELQPENLEPLQAMGVLYVNRGDFDAALPLFEEVLDAVPSQANGFMLIASNLGRAEDPGRALDFMQRLVERHQEEAMAHFAHANLALRAERFEQAVEASDRALGLQSELVEARVLRAQALTALGEEERAIDDMTAALEAEPDNFELREGFGRLLLQFERYDEARPQFERLLKNAPQDPELLYLLGLLNLEDKEYDEADAAFERLAETGQRNDRANYYRGRAAEARERPDEAIRFYERVEAGDFRLDAQARIADLYATQGKLDRAREQLVGLRRKAEDEQTSIRLYLVEGELLREAGEYEQGIKLFNRALTEHPNDDDLLYARALMAEKLDRLDVLEADLRRIIEEDPENASALNALGYTLAERDIRIDEALDYITRALRVKPNDPAVMDSMGWVQYRLGNYGEAEEYLRKALSLQDDPEIAGHLSETMWAQGNRQEARDVLRQALEENPEDKYLLELKERFSE